MTEESLAGPGTYTIGVVVPYYQRTPGLLTRAVRSVIAQQGASATSIIIVDDGSPCPARAELAALPEASLGGLRLITQANAGVAAARNRALDAMPDNIEFIAFLDSDDIWYPNHLANACAALGQGYDFYFADHRREGAAESRFAECGLNATAGIRLSGNRNVYAYGGDLFSTIFRKSPVGTPTVVFRRVVSRDLRFNPALRVGEDALFWLSLIHRGARAAFGTDEEVMCGRGVNIYAGPAWGSKEMLALLAHLAEFHRIVPELLPISADLKASNSAWRSRIRSDFAAIVFHLACSSGSGSIDWRVVWRYLCSEPRLAGDIVCAPAIAMLRKIRRLGPPFAAQPMPGCWRSSVLSLLRILTRTRAPGERRTTYGDRYVIAGFLSLIPLRLRTILALFGSDKQRPGQHSYGATYEAIFRRFRYRRIKILEIGLLGGDSLLSWRCYFPFATTIGIDIDPKPELAGKKTRVYAADQSSAGDLAALVVKEGPFDIIIDDGSHQNAHQIFTFLQLFESLSDGGVYVIEDTQTSFWPGEVNGLQWDGAHITDGKFVSTCYGFFLELVKYLNHAEFLTFDGTDPRLIALGRAITRIAFEHNLIVIWKGANDQPSNYVHHP